MLTSPAMDEVEMRSAAARWLPYRGGPHMIIRHEIVSRTEDEFRSRQGAGPRPSIIALDLPFLRQTLPSMGIADGGCHLTCCVRRPVGEHCEDHASGLVDLGTRRMLQPRRRQILSNQDRHVDQTAAAN